MLNVALDPLFATTGTSAAPAGPVFSRLVSLPTTALGLALLLAAALLILMHWRAWQAAQRVPEEQRGQGDLQFAWRQFRRRVQSSGMIGLVGLGMLVGQFLRAPLLLFFFWTAILVLLVWIVLLAAADALATKQHFSRVRRRNLDDHLRDQIALHRALRSRSDGPPTDDSAS